MAIAHNMAGGFGAIAHNMAGAFGRHMADRAFGAIAHNMGAAQDSSVAFNPQMRIQFDPSLYGIDVGTNVEGVRSVFTAGLSAAGAALGAALLYRKGRNAALLGAASGAALGGFVGQVIARQLFTGLITL